MSRSSVKPDRLYQILQNTGLQNKDNRLYQLLFYLIGNILDLVSATGGGSSGGGSGTQVTVVQQTVFNVTEEYSGDQTIQVSGTGGSASGGVTIAQVTAAVSLGI